LVSHFTAFRVQSWQKCLSFLNSRSFAGRCLELVPRIRRLSVSHHGDAYSNPG